MLCTGFEPFVCDDSEILILGSFPSVKSRSVNFYYGHPQNRFWKTLAEIFGEKTPVSTEEKKDLLKRRKIALWDMVVECEIEGSMDANIKNPVIADVRGLISASGITRIFANGKTAYRLLTESFPELRDISVYLPSTSPANPYFSFDAWRKGIGG